VFSFRQNPSPDLGPDLSPCEGDTVDLNVDFPGATVQWSDGSFGESLTALQSGTYTVSIVEGTCSGSDTVVLSFVELPEINLGNDLSFCDSDTILLQPLVTTFNTTYSWNDNQGSLPTLEVTIPQNTTEQTRIAEYILTANRQGCIARDTITLTALRTTPIDLGQDSTVCDGDSILLSLHVGTQNVNTILWSTDQTSEEIYVDIEGNYSVDVESIDRCISTDQIEINTEKLPILNFDSSYNGCEGDTILVGDNLTPEQGVSYRWTDGVELLSRNVFSEGSYTIVATSDNCSSSATTNVFLDSIPIINLGSDTSLCPEEQLILFTPIGLDEVRWQDGSTSTEYVVSEGGIYELEVRQGACVVSERISVIQPEFPKRGELVTGPQTLCKGTEVLLNASWPNADISWSTGETSPRILVDTPGMYAYTLSINGCEMIDSTTVLPPSPGLCPTCNVFLPTAFSPNGDAVNDLVRILVHFRIFHQIPHAIYPGSPHTDKT